MKLDKVRFAALIGYISRAAGCTFSVSEIAEIDDLIDMAIPVVETSTACANPLTVKALMEAMRDGKKIDAIKAHRSLTGYGLKESKDAVEAAWYNGPKIDPLDTVRGPVNFDKFEG